MNAWKSQLFLAGCIALGLTACQTKSNNVWEDGATSSSKNARSLWDSDDGLAEGEFVPLKNEDLKAQFADAAIPQSKFSPGDGSIPGIDQFQIPAGELASIFRPIFFNTDDHSVRGQESQETIHKMAAYLKAHPKTYLFVEGHADERGPEAYNLSLGSRRANGVRSLLVKEGVNLNQIFTISYGKERPFSTGHNPDAWSQNRRAQIRLYQQP
jgi:peptidoglycan-associated lipoprotein